MSIVELENVTKTYERGEETISALDEVSFIADRGEFVSVMGPSGSGKSTLLNILGLLDSPTDGNVYLNGEDTIGLNDRGRTIERRRSIGFIFQDFNLVPTLTATENVELPSLFSDSTGRRFDRAVSLLTRVDLENRLKHRPHELSGGQKQRVAIARSLINSPKLLLADEPTGNLDQKTGRTILEEFSRIKDNEQVTIIAVTHDKTVSEYADRVVELVDGRIQS